MAPFTIRALRLARTPPRRVPHTASLIPARTFHTAPALSGKKDDLMDKDSMETGSTEYSKSGGDNAAAHTDEAFDPNSTSPDQSNEEKPLDVSPGNPEVSKPRGETEGGAERSPAEANGKRSQMNDSHVRGSQKNGGESSGSGGGSA